MSTCAALADQREAANALKAQWELEKTAIGDVRGLREEIEQVRREIERAEREYDLNRAAELRHGKLPDLQARLEAEDQRMAGHTIRLLREEVTETKSPRWCRAGPGFRCSAWWRASAISSCAWMIFAVRGRRCSWSQCGHRAQPVSGPSVGSFIFLGPRWAGGQNLGGGAV